MFTELYKYGRKTLAEFKTQLVETFNLKIEKQKNLGSTIY
jgi:hypothetical protein